MTKRLIVIDSNSIIHRAYHALPPLTTKNGDLVNAVYGFLLVFFRAIREFSPEYIAACFDVKGPCFRHKEFKDYKAKRPPAPKELYQQIPKVKEVLDVFNVPIFEKEGFEADDIIGTISKLALTPHQKNGGGSELETIILSGDLDTLQLINPQTKVFVLRKGVKDIVLYDIDKVKEKYQGLTPDKLVDFKALRGDPSDNIPGVRGVGEKTAIELLNKFGCLENLYEEIGKIQISAHLKKKLLEQKEMAFLSKRLAQIKKDAPINFELNLCRWKNPDKEKAIRALENFEFHSLIKRLSEIEEKSRNNGKNLTLW